MKDDIISNLNHIIVNEPNKPTIESLIRNDKINQVLNYDKEDYEYLVVDLMNLRDAFVNSHTHYLSNVKFKKEQVERLVKFAGSRYKILLTCQIYNSISYLEIYNDFACGNDLLYKSDLIFLVGEKIKSVKNRWAD